MPIYRGINHTLVLTATLALAADAPGQQPRPQPSFSGSLQTGLAETFQLTLGGTFGLGPAWQNRLTLNLNHVFRRNDAISVYGWDTLDTRSAVTDWQAGVCYRMRLIDRRPSALTGSIGYQRWRFASVFRGTNDHLAAANLTWQWKKKLPFTVSADSWRVFASPYRLGSILYLQGWTTHTLWSNDRARVVLRPSAATTYSWHFWDKGGLRVFRYGGGVAYERGAYSLEGGVRQQKALLGGIPENRYWSLMLTRSF